MPKKVKLGRVFGLFNTLTSIPEALKLAQKLSDNTAPLIDKAIERHYDLKKDLIPVQNLVHLDVELVKSHLEEQGLKVIAIPATPLKKYHNKRVNEVVDMTPKSGKLKPGSIVKVYYLDSHGLDASQSMYQSQVAKTQKNYQKLSHSLNQAGRLLKRKNRKAKHRT